MATGPNCVANTPVNHEYYITDYDVLEPLPAPGTSNYVSRFTAENFGLARRVQTTRDEGTGVRWVIEGSSIETRNLVNGSMSIVPRPDQMPFWAKALLGNNNVGTSYRPAGEVCGYYHIGHYDPTIDRMFQYDRCVSSTWQLSASDTNPLLRLELNVEAGERRLTDTVGGTVQPTLPLSIVQPYSFCYAQLNINHGAGVTSYRMKDCTISGNNNLDTEGFYNSCNREEIPSTFQEFTLEHSLPFDVSVRNLFEAAQNNNVSADVTFVSGPYTMLIRFPSLFARPEDPTISGRTTILAPFRWEAQYDPNTPGETPIEIILTP